ncbi:hypothetical protein ACFPTO_09065 [Paraburkholderia denitrificans]|uniref:Lipoprotein n=1 Tax=Paraburkholderia denitrificans TaxID=694025 RepID=A0ABW0J7N2_9BURK
MNRSKVILGAIATAIACASGAAHAARWAVGVGVGAPWYYPAPYYYAPGPVIVAPPPEPPVWIEQGQPPSGPADQAYSQYSQGPADAENDPEADNSDTWYYCDASRTYYPYVKQCASGWRPVPAQPAPEN